MTPFITTFPSKKRINPLDLQDEDIVLEDVAHHLAIQTRWCGASAEPFHTAQHAVFVSRIAVDIEASRVIEGYPGGPELRLLVGLQGLHHDDSEYALGDITKWLKESPQMGEYRMAEDSAQTVLYRHWELPQVMYAAVEDADRLMARFEGAFTFGRNHVINAKRGYTAITEDEWYYIKAKLGWYPWDWRYAEQQYLLEHRKLVHALEDLRDRRARKRLATATPGASTGGGLGIGLGPGSEGS